MCIVVCTQGYDIGETLQPLNYISVERHPLLLLINYRFCLSRHDHWQKCFATA